MAAAGPVQDSSNSTKIAAAVVVSALVVTVAAVAARRFARADEVHILPVPYPLPPVSRRG